MSVSGVLSFGLVFSGGVESLQEAQLSDEQWFDADSMLNRRLGIKPKIFNHSFVKKNPQPPNPKPPNPKP